MATLIELEDAGAIEKIELSLEGSDQPWRTIYATPDFKTWMQTSLPNYQTAILGGDIEPDEQVFACLYDYVVGENLDSDIRFKKLHRTPNLHVWELKTIEVRIFGWVPEKDVFICCFGDMKDTVELMNSYGTYMARTDYVRSQLNLNEPKSVESGDYDDVVSDAPQR